MLRKVKKNVLQVTKWLLETMLIKKAKASLLQSHNTETCNITVNEFFILSNSASFHVMFDEDGLCCTKWLGKTFERMCLFEFFPTVDTSKQKKHSSMTSMNSMYTWSLFIMEQLFVAIQTISPMESGMIG